MKYPDMKYEISRLHISAIQVQRFQRGRTLGGTGGEDAGAAGAAGGRSLPTCTLAARRGGTLPLSARLALPLTQAGAGDRSSSSPPAPPFPVRPSADSSVEGGPAPSRRGLLLGLPTIGLGPLNESGTCPPPSIPASSAIKGEWAGNSPLIQLSPDTDGVWWGCGRSRGSDSQSPRGARATGNVWHQPRRTAASS
jgi:hypothetical protein